jgi:hypothetical protein
VSSTSTATDPLSGSTITSSDPVSKRWLSAGSKEMIFNEE